jgi:6-phosphofructokinase 2
MIVASGSVPAGVPPDIFARIGDIAKKKKAKFIVDTSGEPLKLAAAGGVYLLKPNMRELGSLVENEELTTEMAAGAAKELVAKGQCEVMVVSMGAAGALLVTREEQYVVKPPHVLIKSTVGAGDSMVAGMVLGLSNNKTMLEVLQYGVACGTAATMNPGTALCRWEDALFLYDQLRQVRHQYHDDSMRVKTG